VTPDQSLLHADQRARRDALDISRSFIVQAPAGAGKTELLIQRYLRLLSIVDDPEEVLAITFTRKAAAEMQVRVLAALKTAAQDQRPDQEHQRITADLAKAALARDNNHGWQLLANPRRMRIQTLDSLHASIARARPLASPQGARGARIVVDAELRTLHHAAALATLDWLTETGPFQEATREVLVHVDANTTLYVAYLSRMLATRDQWLPFIGSGRLAGDEASELRARFESDLSLAVEDHLQRTLAAFTREDIGMLPTLWGYATGNVAGPEAVGNPVTALQEIHAFPAATTEHLSQWIGIAEFLLTKSGSFRKTVDKRQGFPAKDTGQKAAMKELLEKHTEDAQLAELLHAVRGLPPTRYSDDQWNVLVALFRLLPLAVTELRRLFAEHGVADHIEVALTAGAVLGTAENPGDVALLLDYQVRHLLIDEMQDTSAAQYRMLEALTGGWEPGDGRTLYCVGDPMQSIYRFRNAEVGQFMLARQHGIGGITLTPLLLRQNFRSGEYLVAWFNRVFPEIFSPRDEPLNGAVSYSAAVSTANLAGQGECVVHPLFDSDKKLEGALGCTVIDSILAEHPHEQVAVLVRSRTQLPPLLAALREAGIRYRAVEIDRLTDLPEIIEVLALTRAAAHPGDRLAWLAILRAAWIGLDWSDLHTLAVNDTTSTVWELLQDETRLSALSVAGRQAVTAAMPALELLVRPRRSMSLRELIEQCWMMLGGAAILNDEYSVNNVYRFLEVLEKHERRGSLEDVAELESVLDLERVSTDASARLQVMTMHRSKGLQFDHVLLYGMGRISGRSDRSVLSWFDMPGETGRERKIISPVGPRGEIDNDPLHRFIEQAEKRKDRHEQVRLLYVACTRAQKSLHLIGHVATATDGKSYKSPARGTLLHLLWRAVEPEFERAFGDYTGTSSSGPEEILIEPVLRRFNEPWELPDIELLPMHAERSATADNGNEVEFYWVGNEARIAGTLVHRWLQQIAEGRAVPDATALTEFRPVTERWLRELGISGDASADIVPRVELALNGILTDEKGRWILGGKGYAEFGLTGVIDGQIEAVVLDRVRIDDDGNHWIIDYKTSSHEGGNLAGFLAAESERYGPQLNKYAAIYSAYTGCDAHCGLYFPLLQRFVEL